MGLFSSSRSKVWWVGSMTGMVVLVISVSLVSMACAGDTNRETITAALNKAMEQGSIELRFAVGRVGDECGNLEPYSEKKQSLPNMARFHAAQKAGLITISPDGPGFWKVEVVDPNPGALESMKRMKHNTYGGCDSVPSFFPVATKSVVEITKINQITSEKVEVAFTWKWMLTPYGEKVVNILSEPEREQLNPYLRAPNDPLHKDTTFNFANITASTTPHPERKALKKAGDGWALDE